MTAEKLYHEYSLLTLTEREKFLFWANKPDKSGRIISYTVSGNPLTHEQELFAIQEAIEEDNYNEGVSMEEVIKMFESREFRYAKQGKKNYLE